MTWEGRSALVEPYAQLARAYRACADAVDAWLGVRTLERAALAVAEEKERTVSDLDYQIAELRAALANHEQGIDRDREAAQRRLVELNAGAERTEGQLVQLATRFCDPLRSRPELGTLFQQLESDAAASRWARAPMRHPSRLSCLAFVVLACACGGESPPASVPLQLVLAAPPADGAQARCPKVVTAPPAPSSASAGPPAPALMRPPATPWPIAPAGRAVVDAAGRYDADKKLDAGRHPAELLSFLALKPGDRVAELESGGGYTTELLARAVGPKGKVWGQNNAFVMKFVDKPWAARLTKPEMKNVVRVDRELDAPLPADAKNLDAVVCVLFYHDSVWMGVERDKMNRAVFDALKHGGQYVVVDHSAPEGSGTSDVKTTHRIDELFVIRDVERSGFHHVASADFLRNPADTRDWNDSPRDAGDRRGTSDRFVLKFIKP